MAENNWEMKAIHKQFDVFQGLQRSYEQIPFTDINALFTNLGKISNQHLRGVDKNKNPVKYRHIGAKIIKNTPENQQFIKFSYIVIVTNQQGNGTLCEIPVFVAISANNKRLYIDLTSTVHHSWSAFLENNNLPPCTFCFPVDGQYNVGGKLKIDFAKSPASSSIITRTLKFACFIFVGAATAVSSFIFQIPPRALHYSKKLQLIVKEWFPNLEKHFILLRRILKLSMDIKSGQLGLIDASIEIFSLLRIIQDDYKEEIKYLWEETKKAFSSFICYLKNKFPRFFESASNTTLQQFLAITNSVDTDMHNLESKVQDVVGHAVSRNSTDTQSEYIEEIFRDCPTESYSQIGTKGKGSHDVESVNPKTDDLLTLSINIAMRLENPSLKDVLDNFEILNIIVKEEFQEKINTYEKMLDAATAAAGHPVNVKLFNENLGITDNPVSHYWREAIHSLKKTLPTLQLKEKIEEINKNKKPFMLPVNLKSKGCVEGLYRCVGPHGTGQLSVKDIIPLLKEHNIMLDGEELSVTVEDNRICMVTNKFNVMLNQEVNSDRSEGFLFISSK